MEGDFKTDIFALVARIPAGKVASYGQLARMAGRPRSARVVGQIMARYASGKGLPCHRVIRQDGTLCEEYEFGVMGLQRELLRAEGVPFTQDGRVDIAECRWDGTNGI